MKLTLDTRRAKQNGTYNLVFRITSYKKFKDITTGYSVNRDEFDVSTAKIINNPKFNEQIQELNTHYVNRFRTFMNNNIGSEDLEAIKSYLVDKLPDEVTVKEFWKEHT